MDNNYGASNTTCTLTFEHKVANGGFLFRTTNSSNTMINAMGITRDGNVGIGTTTPGSKLHVSGKTYLSQTGEETCLATLNIKSTGTSGGSTQHRDIDIWGYWSTNETHNITFNHGVGASNVAYQMG